MPSKEDILQEVLSFIGTDNKDYEVHVVNSDKDVKSLLNDDGELELSNAANIFIGGNILDRGITIKNMLCFFYGRDPRRNSSKIRLCNTLAFTAHDLKRIWR
jgi:hypothetical protein